MVYRKIKTPRDAKGSRSLKLIERTAQSVFSSRMKPKSSANIKHAHALTGARKIVRIDAQPWEERVADILQLLERHRWERANGMYNAIETANRAMNEAARKKAEVETFAEELQASNEEMRATSEEMRAANEEMRAVTEELERTTMDLERFVPALEKHGIGPLTELRGLLESLDSHCRGKVEEHAIADLDRVKVIAAEVHELMESALGYWGLVIGGGRTDDLRCDQVVRRALGNLSAEIESSRAEIEVTPLPRVQGDEAQITRLFEIVLKNALEHRGEAPPSIRISAALSEPVDDGGVIAKPYWILTVSDNGPGIPEQHLPHLFELYHTVSEVEDGAAAGIGLAAAWRIVRRHGGRIWAESRPGGGTAIHFGLREADDGHE